MFNIAKNFLAGKATQAYVNQRITRYGVLQELTIDAQNKTVDLVCALHGETEPLKLRIEEYRIEERAGKSFIRIVRCTCSRPWVQHLLEDFARDRPVEIPPWALAVL